MADVGNSAEVLGHRFVGLSIGDSAGRMGLTCPALGLCRKNCPQLASCLINA